MYSIDELINRLMARARSRGGRRTIAALCFVAVCVIIAVPLLTRSSAPRPAPASADSGVTISLPPSSLLVLPTIPASTPGSIPGNQRIGPPLTTAPPSTTPAPRLTPTTPPRIILPTTPTTAKPVIILPTPVTAPPPVVTTVPTTPDTGIAVPTG